MPTSRLITPTELIATFCDAAAAAGFPGKHRERIDEGQHTVARGFCGFNGHVGFDDGYDFLEYLHGWNVLARKGDWPYVVYASCPPGPADELWTVAQYAESDLIVWRFADEKSAAAFVDALPDRP